MDIKPVPIKLTLRPIYELLTADALEGQGHDMRDVNGEELSVWFREFYSDYCNTMGFDCK